ncbi:MAG: hypothetical protein AB8H47_11830 [Bacteroidia bacterium]
MKFLLAFLLWIFGGAGADSPNIHPGDVNTQVETITVQTNEPGMERVHHTGRRTIIVLDDTQFRPKKH